MKIHPSHDTYVSMSASTYDDICKNCGATDAGTELGEPCPAAPPKEEAMPEITEEEARDLRRRIEAGATLHLVEPANGRQVGGTHYHDAANGGGEQHWDRMWRLYREAWFVGNITKYVERYRGKDGIKDLLKAQHYLAKLIELETAELKAWEKEADGATK